MEVYDAWKSNVIVEVLVKSRQADKFHSSSLGADTNVAIEEDANFLIGCTLVQPFFFHHIPQAL